MPIEPRALIEQTRQLNEVTTHPEFLRILEELSEVPEEGRLMEAQQRLTPQALSQQGVPIPKDFRVTLRYFEDPKSRNISVVGIGSSESSKRSLLDELARNPALMADLARSRPDIIGDIADRAAGISVCVSVGLIVCATIGGEVPLGAAPVLARS